MAPLAAARGVTRDRRAGPLRTCQLQVNSGPARGGGQHASESESEAEGHGAAARGPDSGPRRAAALPGLRPGGPKRAVYHRFET
jgi:hypothetical protein